MLPTAALFLLPLFDLYSCGALERRSEQVRRADVDAEVVKVVDHELADAQHPLRTEIDEVSRRIFRLIF
jgi:hypothetical protein